MHEESQSSIRSNNPNHYIEPIYYAKAIRWLSNYLDFSTNDALLSVIFHASQSSCQPIINFVAWAIQKNALVPSVGVTTTEGLLTMIEVLRSTPSSANKAAIDWLRFHVQHDKELQAIIINLYDPTDPPFYHFVAWTLKRQLLKPLTKTDYSKLNEDSSPSSRQKTASTKSSETVKTKTP